MRVMGLDIGERRIGVALSDTLQKTAHPHGVIRSSDHEKDASAIRALADEYDVVRIVVGMPVSMSGQMGPQARKTQAFVEMLRGALDVPIDTYDERLSTVSAGRLLAEAGVKPAERRRVRDALAAAVILQTYLDARGNT